MKKITTLLVAMTICLFAFSTASAQDKTALVPLPSLDDFTKGKDGWAFGLGLGVEYETAYEGSDEFGLELQPAGAVQWRKGDNIFYFAGEAFGWRGLRNDH
ncbi:type 1 periplasmic-binding domain-containing protein [Fluctibacter halophilus]|uniref:hypothetical protein n=1 Tax=Fluctibacter halophilus TaxID=226011 RepID=UPI001E3F7B1E|nr:hypothetical protein [Aestuariibacter halophilus]